MSRQDNNFLSEGIKVPDSRKIECQVLADLVSSPDLIPTAKGIITPDMFSDEKFRKVWNTLNDMSIKRENIDLISLNPRIGASTMSELLSANVEGTAMSAVSHCRALCDMFTRRTVFLQSWEMMKMAQNGGDINDLISQPGKLVDAITNHTRPGGPSTVHISDVLNELAEEIQMDQENRANGKRTRVPTGFQFLDELTYGGFNAGDLVVLSGRPSDGKTAIMLQMATASARYGFPATIYTLEMSKTQLGRRMVFSTELVTPEQMSLGGVNWHDLETAIGRLCDLPIYLNNDARTLDAIVTDIILNNQQGRCRIAFIDYLGLIRSINPRMPLYQIIGEHTARLKEVASQCHIPIVLLCQLNRDSSKDDRTPELYDLRDSGSIEQDADIVLMLERTKLRTKQKDDPDVTMWVRKNRNGKAGNVCLRLRGNETMSEFYEMPDPPDDDDE